jgi:hypothetical protein
MDEKLGADLELFKQARLAPGDLRSGAVVSATGKANHARACCCTWLNSAGSIPWPVR